MAGRRRQRFNETRRPRRRDKAPPPPYISGMRSWLAVIPLLFLLALAFYIAGTAWMRFNYDIPFIGWLAIIGGAAFSLLVGGGLMALLFYSSRHGYDDLSGGDHAKAEKPEASWKRTDSA
jgi:hypothetical protein